MNADHLFTTSGSTAAPRQWLRSQAQMASEAALIYGKWSPEVAEIISFAPTSHSYGMILGQVGAQVMNARLQVCSLERQQLPTLEGEGACVILAIASTWRILPTLLKPLANRRDVLVVHSASVLPPDALAIVQRFAGPKVRFVELLGSTETGAMAYRELDGGSSPEQPWTLLDDVTLLSPVGEVGPLEVGSLRIARAQGAETPAPRHRCDDLVQPLDARRLLWLGRVSSLIKVNGLRLDLARLASDLSQRLSCPSIACVPVRDALRAETFEVVFSSLTLSEQAVQNVFDDLPPGHPRPAAVRRVADLPLSTTGKPQVWAALSSVKECNHDPR
ncbi:AMP-binding protein [Pseudomonas sp. Teo4]|uniref:AMP-binding protein n=1 Tax=Pseudomonas sp. Teo4 TaxID=3064528 RepID=UPI002ABC2F30|nr:acyl-CoA synthetase [Pseudomonas sp. Teo4]MDZ3991806.1 hypothetical protein [Pseudomonas sp. Teo4]